MATHCYFCPFVPRPQFLELVGNPEETEVRAFELNTQAQALYTTIRDLLYTKAGKRRADAPSQVSEVLDRATAMRNEATDLMNTCARQRKIHMDPWSHTRGDILEKYGLLRGEGPFQVYVWTERNEHRPVVTREGLAAGWSVA